MVGSTQLFAQAKYQGSLEIQPDWARTKHSSGAEHLVNEIAALYPPFRTGMNIMDVAAMSEHLRQTRPLNAVPRKPYLKQKKVNNARRS